MNGIKKIHLDNFAGNDKVCFLKDRAENEEGFYSYEQSGLERQQGYYIYYEKNEKMKKIKKILKMLLNIQCIMCIIMQMKRCFSLSGNGCILMYSNLQ